MYVSLEKEKLKEMKFGECCNVICMCYSNDCDSGVRIKRFDYDGNVIWDYTVEPTNIVCFDGYTHKIDVCRYGNVLKIKSIGSSIKFVEEIDIEKGEKISRRWLGRK